MIRLRGFQLSRPSRKHANREAYGNGTRLLECHPRDQLQRLGFRGIRRRTWVFWKTSELEDEPELSIKLDLIRGFVNLKRVSLRYCSDAFDDDVMRFIVTQMTSLEELEVSYFSKLTDAGLQGTSEDGSDSISNIKGWNIRCSLSVFPFIYNNCFCYINMTMVSTGLKELSIRCCPLMTPQGILSCLHFPLLWRFDYSASTDVPNTFAFQVT